MSLAFTTSRGSYEQRWIVYAMLRDNVQHHLEGGQPSADFSEIHSIARALGGSTVMLSATRLRVELMRAKEELIHRPADQLAISLRTRSVLSLQWPPPERRATTLVKESGESVPLLGLMPTTMDDVFGHFIDGLLAITDGCAPGDTVQVVDL